MKQHPVLMRFLDYAMMDTQSKGGVEAHPSSDGQTVMLNEIEHELHDGGITEDQLRRLKDGSLLVRFPGTKPGKTICYAAHVDSHPDAPGGAKCIVHDYQGGDIVLPEGGTIISANDEHLAKKVGRTIVTASGNTTLAADDKAGVAILVQTMLNLASGDIADHPPVDFWLCVDEEVGQLDVSVVPEEIVRSWDGLITLDGDHPRHVDVDCFCGWETTVEFKGVSAHPGVDGKKLHPAHYALSRLVVWIDENCSQPWETAGTESFVYVAEIGDRTNANTATAKIYPRSFDPDELPRMHRAIMDMAIEIASYYNVACKIDGRGLMYVGTGTAIKQHPEILAPILRAISEVVGEPIEQSVRGGTDGAMINIAYPDLPAPNLGVGMYNFHGVCEFLVVEEMIAMYEVMQLLVPAYADAA